MTLTLDQATTQLQLHYGVDPLEARRRLELGQTFTVDREHPAGVWG